MNSDAEVSVDPIDEYRRLHQQLISAGYSETRAGEVARVQYTLAAGTSNLIKWKSGRSEGDDLIAIYPVTNDETAEPVLHDDVLLTGWKTFTKELSSAIPSEEPYIYLVLREIHLDKAVSDMLLQSFKTAPLISLSLINNGVGTTALEFAVSSLAANSKLKCLLLRDNCICSEYDAQSLVSAVVKHPTLDALCLMNCGIGQHEHVIKALLPAFALKEISLKSNNIGSNGSKLIANYLASNPAVKELYLQNNLLNDDDARMFAKCLSLNNNLRLLNMKDNHITRIGAIYLLEAVFNLNTLNEIYDSNHTCNLVMDDDEGIQTILSSTNLFAKPKHNRKVKLLEVLCPKASYRNIQYINETPIMIMPEVIDFLQGKGFIDPEMYNGLDAVYHLMREWNMPLLYTGRVRPELRRSIRIRKLKIVQLLLGEK